MEKQEGIPMKLKLTGLSQQLQFAAAQLAPLLEIQLCAPGEGGEVVDCSMSSEGGLSVKREDGRGTIGLASAAQFGRALCAECPPAGPVFHSGDAGL